MRRQATRGLVYRDCRTVQGEDRPGWHPDRAYLLSLDVDRLLHTFRLNAGLPSSAKPYGGWEEPKGELLNSVKPYNQ